MPKEYALKGPVLRGGQYIYEIEPACPHEDIRALTNDVLQKFGGMNQFGFVVKTAIDQDGNSTDFTELAFKENVSRRIREDVVAYVKAHINIK